MGNVLIYINSQVYDSQCHHHKVRLKCVEYIGTHRDDFKEVINSIILLINV